MDSEKPMPLKTVHPGNEPVSYRGKRAKTGNSQGIRFEKALFQSHPEFSGEVHAHVIAPGRMLVVADHDAKPSRREDDPVLEAFLSFLADDILKSPWRMKPLDRDLVKEIDSLVGDIAVDPGEDLGDEPLL
jgi:prlF antitoxin for toxin YhaV_toxin